MSAVVETHNLTKRYRDKLAVNSLDLTVQEGEIFGFLGVLLAIPVTAVGKIFVARAVTHYRRTELYLGGSQPDAQEVLAQPATAHDSVRHEQES